MKKVLGIDIPKFWKSQNQEFFCCAFSGITTKRHSSEPQNGTQANEKHEISR